MTDEQIEKLHDVSNKLEEMSYDPHVPQDTRDMLVKLFEQIDEITSNLLDGR